MLSDQAREARRAYKRAWAQRNPDKVQRYQETYWTKRAAVEAGTPRPPVQAVKDEGDSHGEGVQAQK